MPNLSQFKETRVVDCVNHRGVADRILLIEVISSPA
jgi:hypothetical protein